MPPCLSYEDFAGMAPGSANFLPHKGGEDSTLIRPPKSLLAEAPIVLRFAPLALRAPSLSRPVDA